MRKVLKGFPENTKIMDPHGLAFSCWDGKLALVCAYTDRDFYYNPPADKFNPEDYSTVYNIRYAIDLNTGNPIPANPKHLGIEPHLSAPSKPYEQNVFQIGGGAYNALPYEKGTFGNNHEVWVQEKFKDLGENKKRLVEKYLKNEKHYIHVESSYKGSSTHLALSGWRKAFKMSYQAIQDSNDYKMINDVDYVLDKHVHIDLYSASPDQINKVWQHIPGLLYLNKKGCLQAVITR